MRLYCCLLALLLAAMLQDVSRAYVLQLPVSVIALEQMQRRYNRKSWTGSGFKLNYKRVEKDELAVCKGTRTNQKNSALLPRARLGAARAPRERLARAGTRPKIHFLSFLWMCRRPSTDTAPSET